MNCTFCGKVIKKHEDVYTDPYDRENKNKIVCGSCYFVLENDIKLLNGIIEGD